MADRRTSPAFVVALALLPVLVALAALVSADRYFRGGLEQQLRLHGEEARRAVPGYRREQAILAADPFFQKAQPDADAGDFLSPCFHDDSDVAPPPGEYRTAIEAAWKARLSNKKVPERPSIGVSWMKSLNKYGYWSTTKCNLYRADPEFAVWARQRLLEGLDEGDARWAAADVRQLAWLYFSTENRSGLKSARQLLEDERAAFDLQAAAGRTTEGWTPMSVANLRRLATFEKVLGDFWNPSVPEDVRDAVSKDALMGCIALNEAASGQDMRFTSVEDVEYLRWLKKRVADPSPCRLGPAKFYLANEQPVKDAYAFSRIPEPWGKLCPTFPSYCRDISRLLYEVGLTKWQSGFGQFMGTPAPDAGVSTP
jgi:hypothetical protein